MQKRLPLALAVLLMAIGTVFVVGLVGCGSAAVGLAGYGQTVAQAPAAAPSAKLLIFGGPDHRTYLGCLNCSKYDPDSVSNSYGQHGSRYSSESIWNRYSDFGSRYSTYGACNPYASDPPVIVDQNGAFYGRLTLNKYHPQFGARSSLYDWLSTVVCAD